MRTDSRAGGSPDATAGAAPIGGAIAAGAGVGGFGSTGGRAAASAEAAAIGSPSWRRGAAGLRVRGVVAGSGVVVEDDAGAGALLDRPAGRPGAAASSRLADLAAGLAVLDRFGAAAGGGAGTAGESSPAALDCVPTSVAPAVLRRGRGAAAAGVPGAASERGVDRDVAAGGAVSAGGAGRFLRRAISGLRSP
jgi:hypothetical protein